MGSKEWRAANPEIIRKINDKRNERRRNAHIDRPSSKSLTKEYRVYYGMRERCYQKSHKSYHLYGARGIKVCDRWLKSYDDFIADMGIRPSPHHTIDRIDNNGDYEPSNCRWATRKEQYANKRKSYWVFYELNGERLSLTQWARRLEIDESALRVRIKNWPIERALTEKCNKGFVPPPFPKGDAHYKRKNKF